MNPAHPRRRPLLALAFTARLAAAIVVVVVVVPSPLPAADFYVSERGSDTAPGTSPEQAFLTLQRADSAVKPGDTVHVMNGTYRNATVLTGGGRNAVLKITTSGTPDAWITWHTGDTLIENNLCYNNGGAGIHAFKINKAAVDVFNNTLWRNQQLWLLYEMGAHTVKRARFLNNIVYADRAREVTSKAEAGVLFDHNLYFGSYKAVTIGPNDRLADPLFVMPSTFPEFADFRLQPGSPAIDTGVTVETMARPDLSGQPRPQGAAPDRGAYEAGGGSAKP